MNRNDEISIAWYHAAAKAAGHGPSVTQATVPALSTLDFCASCAAIDLPSILRRPVEEANGNFIIGLGTRVELKASTCPLCRFFGDMAPSDRKRPYQSPLNLQLRALSATQLQTTERGRCIFGIRNRLDATVLGILHEGPEPGSARYDLHSTLDETGFFCLVQTDKPAPYFGVRVLSEALDAEFVKRCLSHCRDNHSLDAACRVENGLMKRCSPTSGGISKSWRQYIPVLQGVPQRDSSDTVDKMRYFRLIDCTKRAVVKAHSGSLYVALSYVWGAPRYDDACLANVLLQWPPVLKDLPKTIDDCIEATLLFGLKYLWVDRYCINQSNPEEQQDQVSVMDIIYANAELTIIAAAGNGPDSGLPGINNTKRSPQPAIKIGDITLASTLPHPSWSLRESKWATRGWTYQEGLLSKRRLIFTPQQTYFECNNMHITESTLMPLDGIHLRQEDEDGDLSAGAFVFNSPGSSPIHLKHLIAEYCERDLTYPGDKLNAMKGIFMYFAKLRLPVDHLMGIPMVSSVTAASYNPANCFLAGLSWQVVTPGKRIPEFPSWSWAGCDGTLNAGWQLYNSSALGSDMRVWIERPDRSLWMIPSEHSPSSPSSPSSSFSRKENCRQDLDLPLANTQTTFIHILARTFTFHITSPHKVDSRVKTDLGRLGGFIYHRFHSDRASTPADDKTPLPKTLTGIIIGDPADVELRETMIIGVDEREEFAERVGVFSFLSMQPLGSEDDDDDDNDDDDDAGGSDGKIPPDKKDFVRFLQAQPKRRIRLG